MQTGGRTERPQMHGVLSYVSNPALISVTYTYPTHSNSYPILFSILFLNLCGMRYGRYPL